MSTRRDVLLALPLLAAGWVVLQSMLGGPAGLAVASVHAPLHVASVRTADEPRTRTSESSVGAATAASDRAAGERTQAP